MKIKILSIMIFTTILSCFDVLSNEPKVCFFMNDSYRGESLCARKNNSVESIPERWNDRISSVVIPHGLAVNVYKDINFSGDKLVIKKDTDFVKDKTKRGFNDEISSFEVNSTACFYESDEFSGNVVCLAANESIDLYVNSYHGRQNYHILNPLNDQISSISVPQNMQAVVYEDDNFQGEYYFLTEDFTYQDLERLNINNRITSIKVFQNNNFTCDQRCVIKDVMRIPLGNTFGHYWLDYRLNSKEALISFILNNDDDYSISFVDGGILRVKNRELYFMHNDKHSSFNFRFNDDSDRLSFLSRFNGDYFEIQFIESKGTKSIYVSPLFSSLFDYGKETVDFKVSNFNLETPVVIDKLVLTGEQGRNRQTRSVVGILSCWSSPMLSIYNYVIQGRCNQADRFVSNADEFFKKPNDKILQISGSAKPLPKLESNETFQMERQIVNLQSEPKGLLTQIHSDMNGKALTVPATALACKVSMKDQLLPHLRSRRDLAPGCIEWTLNILTDFTLLFGGSTDSWNSENFGQIIERIIRNGDTGHAVSDIQTETRLINRVQTLFRETAQSSGNQEIFNLKTAFEFSQLSYAAYLFHDNSEDEDRVQTPQAVQSLPLGRYELSLQDFHFIETIPRIRRGERWVEHPEQHFDIEVISGPTEATEAARSRLMPIIDEWRQIYHQVKLPASVDLPTEIGESLEQVNNIEQLHEASRLVSDVTQSWLRTSRDDYIYVIVRLSGQIVSITMAVDINEFDAGIAGSLTNPTYVLHPQAEGSIRGAGTAAIRALADYLSKKGKRALVSSVISQPSAIVKKKVGFRFIEEL
ncbi:peptidase inhibitor family I36 protein [Yersinia nurmii]|uniref:Peptidase inhibitor family I36 protein n=1 Tax=Yersinia nurmii TaxID=685706 RepID=A0AAW7K0Q3_9GAMM|nr:peptidase inhibitor family I36 protein [Yersinia nurmii]MDN0087551.1 peptidase inhibitor family I36 protein [Yersinia nurmii]